MQISSLHNVEFGDKWVDSLPFFVDVTSILKLGTQVQLLLNLVLVLQYAVDPALLGRNRKLDQQPLIHLE